MSSLPAAGSLSPGLSVSAGSEQTRRAHASRRALPRTCLAVMLLAVSITLILFWAGRIGYLTYAIWRNVQSLREWRDAGETDLRAATIPLHNLRLNLTALRSEAWPLMSLLPLAESIPVIGPDVAAVPPLLNVAAEAALAADETLAAIAPVLERDPAQPVLPAVLAATEAHHSQLSGAQAALRRAIRFRAGIPESISPELKQWVALLDEISPLADQALTLLVAAPELLGADEPRTYLLLAQNRDEIRATGGFISSIGILTLDRGELTLRIENSYALDDFARQAYPAPPEPLQKYMGAELWLLRDANWSPDFPTSAQTAAGLYSLGQGGTVSGVIAFDQAALISMLDALGPVTLDDGSTVSADNIEAVLQAEWTPEPGNLSPESRLDTDPQLKRLGQALLSRLTAGPGSYDALALALAVRRSFAEKHLLAAMTQPAVAALLAEQSWDGAIRPGAQDYLYVVDSNVGFNKVNAVAQKTIRYRVDLTDLAQPAAQLAVRYVLPADLPALCDQTPAAYGTRGYQGETRGCYWNYLRVYAAPGADLQSATALPTAGEWMWNGDFDPGIVIESVGEAGTTVFGQFFVVPSGDALETSISYSLPPTVVHYDFDSQTYCVLVVKQPGTEAVSARIEVVLPVGNQLISARPEATELNGDRAVIDLALQTDQRACFTFGKP